MAYKISSDCISCGACEAECPVGAISAGADKYEIDAGKCIDCGACAGVCPVGAPKAEQFLVKSKAGEYPVLFFACRYKKRNPKRVPFLLGQENNFMEKKVV